MSHRFLAIHLPFLRPDTTISPSLKESAEASVQAQPADGAWWVAAGPTPPGVFVEGHNEDIGRGVSPFSHRTGDLREPPKKADVNVALEPKWTSSFYKLYKYLIFRCS